MVITAVPGTIAVRVIARIFAVARNGVRRFGLNETRNSKVQALTILRVTDFGSG
jgi:hypothetical protein